jgi:hypothetical protein
MSKPANPVTLPLADYSPKHFLLAVVDGVATVTLNRPERKNPLTFDAYDLFINSSTDALGNTTTIDQFDFRVLAPVRMTDVNANVTAIAFDARGLPAWNWTGSDSAGRAKRPGYVLSGSSPALSSPASS